jgi:hypothetical protein
MDDVLDELRAERERITVLIAERDEARRLIAEFAEEHRRYVRSGGIDRYRTAKNPLLTYAAKHAIEGIGGR